jgi:hypothetical protein
MEKKNKHVRVGFSTILWAVLAIVLCAAPSLGADVDIPNDGVEYNIPGDFGPIISGSLWVNGTVNLLTGADIEWFVYATGTSVVNIKGGTVGYWIDVAPTATVTLYGTDLALDNNGNGIRDDEDSPLGYGPQTIDGTVVGFYANGNPIDLTFDCQLGATVTLAAPGGEQLEAQLWVFPSLINRYGPLSKILAMVRLPEGISKNDIDSSRPLVLYANGYDDVKIEASCQRIIQWRRNGIVHTTIFASFDIAELIEALTDGKVQLEVVGGLNTGQDFYGIDTVRIVSWSWWRR